MNVLRHSLCRSFQRAYSTRQFVPPAQLHNIGRSSPGSVDYSGNSRSQGRGGRRRRRVRSDDDDDDARENWEPEDLKARPDSQSFYTGRPVYYDQVLQLQAANAHARTALKTLQLLPLPRFARQSLPPLRAVWKNQDELKNEFHNKLTTARYRRLVTLLNELHEYLRIASTAGCAELARSLGLITGMFESGKKDAFLARGQRKKVELDDQGRSYTVGKRKTSAARVWIIPVYTKPQSTTSQPKESMEDIFGIQPVSPPPVTVTTTTILVNNIPLAEYFPIPADRERIVRPFKVAGVLGAYNVFAIVRGGGSTGQSGAVAHGIAKGLVVHEPELSTVLARAKLLRRDPRMVERKKTGLAKARKRYTWVKR